jgi:FkbM family methyltransferase
MLKKWSKSILRRMSGNKFVQKILQKNVNISQYLMGIGSGSGVMESGEHIIFNVLSKRCVPPYCIFDVGSNKGQFLDLALEKISTTDFSIHCFEPEGETFKQLIEKNKDNRVKFNNKGIGKEKGYMTLYYDTPGSGLASLTRRKLDHFGIEFNKSETVQIETIDNYCKENKVERINLLKIDIEGHELDAFTGAKQMFANTAIDIVTFEFGGCNIDTRTFFQDFWYFFINVNMKLFRITPSGYLSQIESYKEIDEQFRTTNFIAIKDG